MMKTCMQRDPEYTYSYGIQKYSSLRKNEENTPNLQKYKNSFGGKKKRAIHNNR